MRTVDSRTNDRLAVIVAGEASGDRSGSAVARELLAARSDLHLAGIGGSMMSEAGVRLLYDSSDWGAIGIADSLKLVPRLLSVQRRMKKFLLQERPGLLLLIDYPFFNMRLAEFAHDHGVPVLYYFPPSSWSRSPRKVSGLAAFTDRVATPFPWSAEVLTAAGCRAEFVGHPALDWARPAFSRDEARKMLKLDDKAYTIGLMPGSRLSEIKYILPVLLGAAERVSVAVKGVQVVLIKAPNIPRGTLDRFLDKSSLRVVVAEKHAYDAMSICDQLLITSGTATLEAAVLGVPMVVIYRGSRLTWMQARHFFRSTGLEHIALPNIILERRAVPELLQYEADAVGIAAQSLSLLTDPRKALAMKQDLASATAVLGSPGANSRVAAMVLEMLEAAG